MAGHIFIVQGHSIPYDIIINPKLKNIRLSINNGQVKVSMPWEMSIDKIDMLLRTREHWILKHFLRYRYIREWYGSKTGENRRVLFRGKEYPLILIGTDRRVCEARFDGEKFELHINTGLKGEERETAIDEVLKKLLASIARSAIELRLKHFVSLMGVKYNNVRIKDQKTRWGSCSGKGNLNFNWRLIMAPGWVMDYVIVHELSHTKYLNHSTDFWDMVSLYMPNWNDARKWLKENSLRLKAF